jgi:putative ABC transport system permease protein
MSMGRSAAEAGIERQTYLSNRIAGSLCMRSIRRRFLRTLITAIGILLGIAFLVSVLSSSTFAEAAARAAPGGIHSARWIAYNNPVQLQETHMRQIWLVALALLVSTIGILNSMLMSVAERYREIGTMKCLGATDGFIVRVFVIEAFLTGAIASVLGGVIGFVLMLLSYLMQEGISWIQFARFGPLFELICIAVASGAVLALLASAWPAAMASRMPPAAAFRVEV